MYNAWIQLIHILFQGAAATGSCEGDHNSGPTSTSANHHDIGPFQCSPNQHPSTLLGEVAFFQLVITRVLLLQEEREVFSRVKESMASESSSKTLTHYKNCGCIYRYPMLCSWTFIPHFLIVCSLYTYRTSGGVAVIHLHTLYGVHSCTVSPPLSTTLHTVIRFTCSLYKLQSLHVLIS